MPRSKSSDKGGPATDLVARMKRDDRITGMAENILSVVFVDQELPVGALSRYLVTLAISELEKSEGFDRARWIDTIVRVMRMEFESRKHTNKIDQYEDLGALEDLLEASDKRKEMDQYIDERRDKTVSADRPGDQRASGSNGSKFPT